MEKFHDKESLNECKIMSQQDYKKIYTQAASSLSSFNPRTMIENIFQRSSKNGFQID